MKSICVFAGSSAGTKPDYMEAAARLGDEIGRRGMRLLYGGATVGLMGGVADAALAHGTEVIGVIPEGLMKLEIAHPGLTELLVVADMHERKAALALRADAFIALPGGLGTFEEIFEAWTWTQLGFHQKAIGFLNVAGYYDGLFAFLDNAVSAGFVRPGHRDMVAVNTDPVALLDQLAATEVRYEPKLTDRGD